MLRMDGVRSRAPLQWGERVRGYDLNEAHYLLTRSAMLRMPARPLPMGEVATDAAGKYTPTHAAFSILARPPM